MNYLAHLALSHFAPLVMLGNFMGDGVKGRDYDRYSPLVRRGLLLHRQIDSFTDSSPIVMASAALFRPAYGHYAGIVCDMLYDHFLASLWTHIYPGVTLHDFASGTHRLLLKNYFRLPGELRGILPFLIKSRRLESYATQQGILRALDVMARHTSLPDRSDEADAVISQNYDLLRHHFWQFYPQVAAMADEALADVPSPHPSAAATMPQHSF